MHQFTVLICALIPVATVAAAENITLTFSPAFEGPVEISPALFGLVHYDEALTGRLVFPDDNVGCTPVDVEAMDAWPVQENIIVIIDRGTCAFEQKVWHMQNAGAKAVIIVDDMDEAKLPYLAAAHSTGDILIPSVIIKKKMGDKLKQYMCSCTLAADPKKSNFAWASPNIKATKAAVASVVKNNFFTHKVEGTLTFGLPNPDDEVEWTLWTSADDMRTVGFKREFAVAARSLGKQAVFQVRYFIRSGMAIGCFHGQMDNKQCENQCTNGGRYCAPDPDSDSFYGLDGKDIVVENLRQLCIFNVTTAKKEQWKWWKYVTEANKECGQFKILPDADKCKRAQVTDDIMSKIGISPTAVRQCMADSGGVFEDRENTILQGQLGAQVDDNVFVQPTIIINGVQYRGNLECANTNNLEHCAVLSAICAGYAKDKKPDICTPDADEWQFKLQQGSLPWASAETACQRQGFGAHLALGKSVDDRDRMFNQCRGARCWIGLNDRTTEGNYMWSDGTALLKKDEHWAPGEPNNGGFKSDDGKDEDCGYIHGRGYKDSAMKLDGGLTLAVSKQRLWGDHVCSEKMEYVCRLRVVRRYQYYGTPLTWEKAEASCTKKGGHLADIQSLKANANVDGQCEAERCWIGINDRTKEGKYYWTDGVMLGEKKDWKDNTRNGHPPYLNWAKGEPNNGGSNANSAGDEDCGYIHGIRYAEVPKRGKWGDHRCAETMPYVCSFPDTIAQTTELPMFDPRDSANIPGTSTKPATTDVFVSVTSPNELAAKFKDGIPLRPALFGVPPYGGHIAGRLVYANSKMSDHGCDPLKLPKGGNALWVAGEAVILIVNRGQCMFTDKVRHGQQAGAAAVIVVDDTESVNLPFMQAGGSARGITIPSMIIHREDGFRLQQFMCGNSDARTDSSKCTDTSNYEKQRVEVKISWDVPKPTGTTSWHWWTSSADPFSTSLKMGFGQWAAELDKKAELTVHYALQAGEDIGCFGPGINIGKHDKGTAHQRKCQKQCTNHGRYCALDWPMADAMIVRENLRQLCVFRSTLDVQSVGMTLLLEGPSATANAKWWAYIQAFEKQCNVRGYVPGQQCFNRADKSYVIMKSVGVDVEAVKSCEGLSGGTTENKANQVLAAQLKARLEEGAFMTPTVSVNGQKYLGNLECTHNPRTLLGISFRNDATGAPFSSCGVLGEICAGFTRKTLPDICDKALKTPPPNVSSPVTMTFIDPKTKPKALLEASAYIPSTDRALTVSVVTPLSLKPKFSSRGIMARPSLFGMPTIYGGVLSGQLQWGGGEGNRNGCKSFKPLPKAKTMIIMVDRGGCTFVVKVRNAMKAGAAAVIIADNTPQSILIYAGATGGTDDIITPSAFIHMDDAILLKQALCEFSDKSKCHVSDVKTDKDFWDPKGVKFDQQVVLQFMWSMPKPKEIVNWKMWLSSVGSGTVSNNASITFERQFQTAAQALGSHADLEVQYQITDGRALQCLPHFGTKDCGGLCTNGGRYCASDPDGKLAEGLSGADVVVEDLRQLCVFNVSKTQGQLSKWWSYVNMFNEKCIPGIGKSWERNCRKSNDMMETIMRTVGLDVIQVNKCMSDSGGTDGDRPNSLLQAQVMAKVDDGVVNLQITTIMINGVKFRGNLGCTDPYDLNKCGVLAAMCAAFAPSVAPALCGGGVSAYTFKHFTVKRDWDSAEKICQRHGGHLARIRSLTDQERVYNACGGLQGTAAIELELLTGQDTSSASQNGGERCWIGLNDKRVEGQFEWADGSAPGFYRLWAKGEPNNGGSGLDEDCAYMHGRSYPDASKRKQWGDHPCADKMQFVCEIPVDFVMNENQLDWKSAELKCREDGGHLANIQSFGDNQKVFDSCDKDRCWLGLNDQLTEGTYRWTDGMVLGSAFADGSFNYWAAGEPSNTAQAANSKDKDEDCVYMHGASYSPQSKRRQWGDHPCTETHASVCEIQAKYYFTFFPNPASWKTAEANCKGAGGHLAHIDSVSMNTRVWDACKGQRCWMGLNDRDKENNFMWTDGKQLSATGYQPWAPGEPNNGGSGGGAGTSEDCVYIHGSLYHPFEKQRTWGDHPCQEMLPYVCQHSIKGGNTIKTSPPTLSPTSATRIQVPTPGSSKRRRQRPTPAPIYSGATSGSGYEPAPAPAVPTPSPYASISTAVDTAVPDEKGKVRVRAFMTLRGDGKDFALFSESLQLGFRKCVVDVLQLEGVALTDVSIKVYDRKPATDRRRLGAVGASESDSSSMRRLVAASSSGNSLVTIGVLILAETFEDAQQVPLPYLSPTSLLPLPYLSPTSPRPLPDLSPTSPLPLPYPSPTSAPFATAYSSVNSFCAGEAGPSTVG
jgi:hypothetical protein